MRLSDTQIRGLRQIVRELCSEETHLRVFGSRLDDHAKGGDLDLLCELPEPVENPALLAARLSAKASRLLGGRKVDVLLLAPNLKRLPIHELALKEGQRI
jgi:predicted nucleotidyltransferase